MEENVAVKLTFLEFFLEPDDNCHYDWMKIYDGDGSDSQVIGGKLCGTNVPEQIVSSTNELIVAIRPYLNISFVNSTPLIIFFIIC